MDLTEHPIEVGDGGERVRAQHHVDRVGPHERELGEVAVVELDLDVGALDGARAVEALVDGSTVMTLAPCSARATASAGPQPSSRMRRPSEPSRRQVLVGEPDPSDDVGGCRRGREDAGADRWARAVGRPGRGPRLPADGWPG